MKIYIVFQNDKIAKVFTTMDAAEKYVKKIGGWNIWKIEEQTVVDGE